MEFKKILCGIIGSLSLALSGHACAQPSGRGPGGPPGAGLPGGLPTPLRIERDLEYVRLGSRALHLDLYLRDAKDKSPLPVVLWVHGDEGGADDKSPSPAARLVAAGYAVASVEYRPADEAPFPGQLNDVKAAVRWLRANAPRYNLDAGHIGAWGSSAGGRLVSLLAVTGDVKALDGPEGNLDQSSRVQAASDFYGPLDQAPMNADKSANPMTYISADDAPLLIVHGAADTVVSPRQSESLQIALKHGGVENDLEYVPGAGHDIDQVQTPAVEEMVANFLDKHLRAGQHQRDDVSTIAEPADAWVDVFPDRLPGTQYKLYPTPSRGAHTQASYRLYLPPGYDDPRNARRRYPVIYYLHGSGDDSRKAVTAGYIPRLDAAERNGLMPAAIVVVVQAPNRAGYVNSADGKTPVESVFIKDLIPHIDQTYRTVADRGGRAIEGHSMGGAGALHMAFKYPELFASVSSLSAALHPEAVMDPKEHEQVVNAQFAGDTARAEAEGAWTLMVKNADRIRGKMSIRLIIGDKDNLGLLPINQWMSDLMDKRMIPHQFVESPGAPHSVKEVLARLDENPFAYYAKVFEKFK